MKIVLVILCIASLLSIIFAGSAIETSTACGSRLWYDKAEISLAEISADIPNPQNIEINAVNGQCYKCAESLLINEQIAQSGGCSQVYTPHPWKLYLKYGGETVHKMTYTFGEHGVYKFSVAMDTKTNKPALSIIEVKSPKDSLEPIYGWIGVFIAIIFVAFTYQYVLKFIKNKMNPSYEKVPLLDIDATESLVDSSGDTKGDTGKATKTDAASAPAKKKSRLDSLDTFRGISLAFMIFVNYGGGGYWFFDHAAWHGLTFADLLFPWFMWMMGVSMALSYSNRDVANITQYTLYGGSDMKGQNTDPHQSESITRTIVRNVIHTVLSFVFDDENDVKGKQNRGSDNNNGDNKPNSRQIYINLIYHSIRRSVILFAIGMFLANGYELSTWRIPGVLQYFGFSYLVVSATVLYWLPTTNEEIVRIKQHESIGSGDAQSWALHPEDRARCCGLITGMPSLVLTAYRYEWIVQVAIVILYMCIHLGAKAPGCPRGYQGPGGLANNGEHWGCTGGIHRWIDMKLFGYELIFHHPTCLEIYECIPYDPEGALGGLSACTLTYLGLMSGRILVHYKEHKQRLVRWAVWAFVLLFLAGIFCGFSQNEGFMPINKNMWTTSFVFVSAGGGLVCLSLTYILVDVLKVWTGAPFRFLGLNSILIYVGHSLLGNYFPFGYTTDKADHAKYLRMNIFGVFSWFCVAYYLFKIKYFVKI